jgi:hypothetical protein
MAEEVFRTFAEPLPTWDGATYTARICGRQTDGGRWEAWIEFVPEAGAPVLRSRRETTQPDRRGLSGWAARLSRVYLEGSLERTLDLERVRPRDPDPVHVRPHFDGPAPYPGSPVAPDDAALNPFLSYRAGSDELLRQLRLLSASELRTVVRAYGLEAYARGDVETLATHELVDLVMEAVVARMGR